VKLVRESTISDEFHVDYHTGPPVIRTKQVGKDIRIDGLSRLGLEALTRAGLIFSIPYITRRASGFSGSTTEYESESARSCYITPEGFRAVDNDFAPIEDLVQRRPPIEITSSLTYFRKDFPDSSRLAFVMMQFVQSNAHTAILGGIRKASDPFHFIALRADDKQYHDNLLFNILTYIYGCRFGIAVFERIESETINPNVSLEVGYLLGLDKPVCFLKDHTLKTLQTDLIGQLYKQFDTQNCESTIPAVLWKWMEDKGIISPRVNLEG
jgi:hypothetical protein